MTGWLIATFMSCHVITIEKFTVMIKGIPKRAKKTTLKDVLEEAELELMGISHSIMVLQ